MIGGQQADALVGRYIVAGLGNPGKEHRSDRHNVGFMVIDMLAERHAAPISRMQQRALIGDGRIDGQRVILAKPQTYMNRSGESIGPLARYFKVDPKDVLVVYDEIDLPFGTIRLREKGGSGGHRGMKSVIQHLGQEFPRLRLGVGRPPGRMAPADYVLQSFGADEKAVLDEMLDKAVAAAEAFIADGIEQAMTLHNGSVLEQ